MLPSTPAGWALLGAVVVFAFFVLLKSRVSLAGKDPAVVEAKKKIQGLKQKVRAARGDRPRQAKLWREAATVWLDELGRPNRAAACARRADKLDPSGEALGLIATAMRRAHRYRALERLLWRRLDEDGEGERAERAMKELLALYEGPARRPEQARVLRKLWEREA